MIGENLARTVAPMFKEMAAPRLNAGVAVETAGASLKMGRDSLIRSTAIATALTSNSVTPAMIADLARVFDPTGKGVIEKSAGFVELAQPHQAGDGLVSNYYDAAFHNGPNVPALPTKTFTDLLGQGYELTVKAQKGEVTAGAYDVIGMSSGEIAKLAKALTDVLAQSPLAKDGFLGKQVPVHYTSQPYYSVFFKPVDRVETWSLGKVETEIRKRLTDKSDSIKINPLGEHADGPFVLAIHDSPVF